MPRLQIPRPSPAMLVALAALCVAMAGTGYAASCLVQSAGPKAEPAADRDFKNGTSGCTCRRGPRGFRGRRGRRGRVGPQGAIGPQGLTGPAGPAAPSQFAQFFALMPPDNAATVAVGGAVEFPQDGPETGDIIRLDDDTFELPDVGTYRVTFNVSVSEAGQLMLTLNGVELAYTVFGRATGTSQITGEALVTTTVPDSLLEVVNPSGNAAALTITPVAGGTRPAAASLIIEQLS